MDRAARDQPVRLPRLAVVREVRSDDPLEVHPEVPVVVLVKESGCGSAGDDRAAALGDVDADAERVAARVLEHDVRIFAAGEFSNALAEAAPFVGVLRDLVLPEREAFGIAIDHKVRTHPATEVRLLGAGYHAHGCRTAVERELSGVRAESA